MTESFRKEKIVGRVELSDLIVRLLTLPKKSRMVLSSFAFRSIRFLPGESSDASYRIPAVAKVLDDADDGFAVDSLWTTRRVDEKERRKQWEKVSFKLLEDEARESGGVDERVEVVC